MDFSLPSSSARQHHRDLRQDSEPGPTTPEVSMAIRILIRILFPVRTMNCIKLVL